MDQLEFPGMPTPTEREVEATPGVRRLRIELSVMPCGGGTMATTWMTPEWGHGREVEFVPTGTPPYNWSDRVATVLADQLPAWIDPF